MDFEGFVEQTPLLQLLPHPTPKDLAIEKLLVPLLLCAVSAVSVGKAKAHRRLCASPLTRRHWFSIHVKILCNLDI